MALNVPDIKRLRGLTTCERHGNRHVTRFGNGSQGGCSVAGAPPVTGAVSPDRPRGGIMVRPTPIGRKSVSRNFRRLRSMKTRFLPLTLAALVVALTIPACGEDDGPTGGGKQDTTPPTVASVTPIDT